MTVIVQRLTDDNEFESIGRVEDGEITDGEDELMAIDDRAVWENFGEDALAARFSGPRVMVGIVDEDDEDDEDEAVEEDFSKTPSGVPDEARGPVGDESDVPDNALTITGPRGGTYWVAADDIPDDADLPDDVDDPRDDGASGRDLPGDPPDDMNVEQAVDYIFDNSFPADGAEFAAEEQAAIAIVDAGNADPDTAADALITLSESDIPRDRINSQGRTKARRVSTSIMGPTDLAAGDMSYTTTGDFIADAAQDEFQEKYGRESKLILEDATTEWMGSMFGEDTAAIFQVAAEQTGNETLPEGGQFGDDDYIDDVLEIPATFTEKDAIRAKQEQTQDALRDAFGDEMTVFRGQSTDPSNPSGADPSDAPARMKEAAKNGETIEHEHRPAESWTTDPGYASKYSNPARSEGEDGVLLKTTVPVEDVVMSSHTSELSARECEVIVAHDETVEYGPDQVTPEDEVTNQTLIAEALDIVNDVDADVEQSVGKAVRIEADEIDPEWLHRDPGGEPITAQKDADDGGIRLHYPHGGVAHSSEAQYQSFLNDVAANGGRIIDTKGFSNGNDRVWPPDEPDAHDPRMVVYGLDEVDVLALLDRYPDVDLQINTDHDHNAKSTSVRKVGELPDEAVPIQVPDEAPDGARTITGPRGGLYYVPEGFEFDGMADAFDIDPDEIPEYDDDMPPDEFAEAAEGHPGVQNVTLTDVSGEDVTFISIHQRAQENVLADMGDGIQEDLERAGRDANDRPEYVYNPSGVDVPDANGGADDLFASRDKSTLTKEQVAKLDGVLLQAFTRQITPKTLDAIEKDAWTSDEDVPEYVVEAIEDAFDAGAIFDRFESISGRVRDVISDTLEDALTDPDGWSLDEMVDQMSDELPRADPDDLEMIGRTESSNILNNAREAGYRDRGLDDAKFYWQGPSDSRTTEACEDMKIATGQVSGNADAFPNPPGEPVTLSKLVNLERQAQETHFPNLEFRKHTLHPNERHTFVRAAGTGGDDEPDVDIDVDVPGADAFDAEDAPASPAELSAKDHDHDDSYKTVVDRVAKATNVTRRVGQIEDALGSPLPVVLRECLESAGSTRGAHKELNRRLSEVDDWDIDEDGKVSTATIYEWADRYQGHVDHLT